MVKPKFSSTMCLRIVLSFIEFLSNVEVAPGQASEDKEIIQRKLRELFKTETRVVQEPIYSLVNLYAGMDDKYESLAKRYGSSSSSTAPKTNPIPENPKLLVVSDAELFHQFRTALKKCNFFQPSSCETYMDRRVRAKNIYESAKQELAKAGYETFNLKKLAEAIKLLGNKAMNESRPYCAIELYDCAVAICEDNAAFYCNRAAAFTRVGELEKAIDDCYEALQLNPQYVKAYCRLGTALFDQGNYTDAICRGFVKALQLDPTNVIAMDNIEMAERKLKAQIQDLRNEIETLVDKLESTRPRWEAFMLEIINDPQQYINARQDGNNASISIPPDLERLLADETFNVADLVEMFLRSDS